MAKATIDELESRIEESLYWNWHKFSPQVRSGEASFDDAFVAANVKALRDSLKYDGPLPADLVYETLAELFVRTEYDGKFGDSIF